MSKSKKNQGSLRHRCVICLSQRTPGHKLIANEHRFWNNYPAKVMNFTRSSLRSSFLLGENLEDAKSQDTFDHDKGQKAAISGRRLHWIILDFLQLIFSLFSRCTVQFSKEMVPKCGENCPISGRRKVRKSCHVCGCHSLFRSRKSHKNSKKHLFSRRCNRPTC